MIALMAGQREQLAQRVLDQIARGSQIAEHDAFQLRNWALSPTDAVLSLEQIALRILGREDRTKAEGA